MKFKRRILKFGVGYALNNLLNNPFAHNVKNLTKLPKVKIALLGLGTMLKIGSAPAILSLNMLY